MNKKPKSTLPKGSILYMIGFILIFAAFFSTMNTGSDAFVLTIPLLAIGFFLAFQGNKTMKEARIKQYKQLISEEHLHSITQIARAVSRTEDFVRNDIKGLINKGALQDTYIDISNDKVIMGKENIERYKAGSASGEEAQKETPPAKTHCPQCGAPTDKQNKTCEYCGTVFK